VNAFTNERKGNAINIKRTKKGKKERKKRWSWDKNAG
jgi:hypothetical protein